MAVLRQEKTDCENGGLEHSVYDGNSLVLNRKLDDFMNWIYANRAFAEYANRCHAHPGVWSAPVQAHSINASLQDKNAGEQEVSRATKELFARAVGLIGRTFIDLFIKGFFFFPFTPSFPIPCTLLSCIVPGVWGGRSLAAGAIENLG